MRNTRAGRPQTVPARQSMNLKFSGDRSMSGHSLASTARALGPTRATVDQWSVTEVIHTLRSGHSVWCQRSSQFSTRAAPPVVVVM